MPEWPDLHVVRGRLEKALVGREIVLVRVGDPLVLRSTSPVETALAHRRFTRIRHRGKFLIFDLDHGAIVVNPMLAGVFELADADEKLTPGAIGQVEVRGANVFPGYWRMPELNREEFTADGFFRTGDMGSLSEDGYLTIAGRSKDLIISGGFNV